MKDEKQPTTKSSKKKDFSLSTRNKNVILACIGAAILSYLIVLTCGRYSEDSTNPSVIAAKEMLEKANKFEGTDWSFLNGKPKASLPRESEDIPSLPAYVPKADEETDGPPITCTVVAARITMPIIVYADNHNCDYREWKAANHPILCTSVSDECVDIPATALIP